MERTPLTPDGAAKLRLELDNLKSVERPQVIKAIGSAADLGDLKENSEYHAARERQSMVEGRIQHLENVLAMADIIDISSMEISDRVVFGVWVELKDLDEGSQVKYRIVGAAEADINAGLLSVQSPLARSLIGRVKGDLISFQAPAGTREYEVIGVSLS